MNLVIFGIYLFVLIILLGFISIVILHIGAFRAYSKYLSIVLRIYIIAVIMIALFGGYRVLTDHTPAKNSNPPQNLDF